MKFIEFFVVMLVQTVNYHYFLRLSTDSWYFGLFLLVFIFLAWRFNAFENLKIKHFEKLNQEVYGGKGGHE